MLKLQENDAPRRVLVLGAGGKVGRMIRAAWTVAPPSALVPVWQSRDGALPDSIAWRPGAPARTLPRVDAILALWGVTGGTEAQLSLNTALALHAQRLGAQLGAGRVLHCSSAAVYAPGTEARDETAPECPASAYGRAKLAMEHALAEAGTGPRHCLMRIGNVAGADSLFASLGRDAPLVLDDFGGGRGPLRSYIGPRTLAGVFERLLTCPDDHLPDCLNVAADPPQRMDAVARAAGVTPMWRPAPECAVETLVLDTPRLDALCECHHGRAAPETLVKEWRECGPAR